MNRFVGRALGQLVLTSLVLAALLIPSIIVTLLTGSSY